MRHTVALLVIAAAMAVPVAAGSRGNFYGYRKAEILDTDGCPVKIKRAGVQDTENTSNAGKFFAALGSQPVPNGDGSAHAASVRYDVTLTALQQGVLAVEVEWLAANAFDEPLAKQPSSFARKAPARANQTWNESESGYRLAEDISKFVVRVTRVKFADGAIWNAPPLTEKEAAPEPPRESK